MIRIGKEKVAIQARFIIGAEGVGSKVRKHMGVTVSKQTYNHDFLTVSFPAPKELKAGEMVATHDRFLGLFPLPNQEVRTVYLIRKGEFKKNGGQSHFSNFMITTYRFIHLWMDMYSTFKLGRTFS